ncbi:MAG TPA: glycoside hydrolase family 2 TIM barrel-domain containing protein [Vicinamibacterales bacterium]|nr:glycoside hydrolase family 2 TIM barrel-domain containing protein [Vicinamibacterales bacterium]
MLHSDSALIGGRGYPRPQLVRKSWISLNGTWEFALDPDGVWQQPADVEWSKMIQVPFAPETRASGLNFTEFFRICWYRREIVPPPMKPGERLLLHFGAVDYRATVWVNDWLAGTHEGGYTPFTIDITSLCNFSKLVLVVQAEDDPVELSKPRGKQDWLIEPHSIWYYRTSGIWQTVWMEVVPSTWISRLRWTPNLERWEMGVEVWLEGQRRDMLRLEVKMRVGEQLLADDTYQVISGEVHRRIALSDPGIDDYRNGLLWNPAAPTLIDVELRLWGGRDELLDEVGSYTALRAIHTDGDKIVLNGRPYMLRMVLDQGYWADTGLTAPDDEALRHDVELAKAMGFNGVRKHQKLEDPRYLYWADRLGLLVWEEMPSAYRFTEKSVQRVTREWTAAIERDYSHPCIMAWVPINESWGVPNLPMNPTERHYVRGLYHLTKTLDPTRPVIGNDGWESVATDIIGIHDYDSDPERVYARYSTDNVLPRLFKRERPGGRVLVLEADRATPTEQPIVLSEFGGIALARDPQLTWGYSRVASAEELSGRYLRLMSTIHSLSILAGFCYTQFADTYQEANGLLYEDRTAKFPIEQIARATRGAPLPAAGPEPQAHNVAAMKASAADTVAPGPAAVPVTIGERPE